MELLIDLDDVDSNTKKQEKAKPTQVVTLAQPTPLAPIEEVKASEPSDPDNDKIHINVKYKNEDHFVSWYYGTAQVDVLDAIVCACDCIMNSGFELTDSSGKPVDLKNLSTIRNNETYTIFEGEEKKEYEKILGDKWRIVKVSVPSLMHPEAHEAIVTMQIGANLLKCTKNNNPHIRLFQLSSDLKRMLWYSSHKPIDQAYIDMTQIVSIDAGRLPEETIKPLESLEHIAFQIQYKNPKGKLMSIYLVCKDEKEFDTWMTGIKALMYHFRDIKVPKLELLGHSRQFNKYIAQKKIIESLKAYWSHNKEANIKGIDDIMNKKTINSDTISKKIVLIDLKLKKADTSVEGLSELGPSHNYYKSLNVDENIADDMTQMKAKAVELLERCKVDYDNQCKAYDAINEKTESTEAKLQEISKGLWRVEVDIENALDICKQIKEKNKPTMMEKLKSILPKIF